MIQLQINADDQLKKIEAALGKAKDKAPVVLYKAANATAIETRTLLAQKARSSYVIKSTEFKKEMTIKKGFKANPVAIVKSRGTPIELFKFKTSPSTYKTGSEKPKRSRARVKYHGKGMKDLLLDGRWAFVTQFKSGHKTMVQRTTEKRLPIKTLYGPSIPSMLGGETEVYGAVKPQIEAIFQKNIQIEISKVLAKGSK